MCQYRISLTFLVFASYSGVVYANTRPSISFGPPVHTAFYTTDFEIPIDLSTINPFDTDESFITTQLNSNGFSFTLRSDTYTDKRTGITHVYARQMADYAHPIANAHMNINIRDKKILSYGTSFLHGNPKSQETYLPTWSLDDHCGNTTISAGDFTCGHFRDRLRALALTFNSTVHPYDPAPAAFFFSLAAHPGAMPSNASLDNITTGFHGCPRLDVWPGVGCQTVYDLPNVQSNVLARRAYIQTPVKRSNSTKISLVWNLEVELANNRYEVYTSLHDPFKVVMVVDWTVDKPNSETLLSRQLLESEQAIFSETSVVRLPLIKPKGTYRVWRWDDQHPRRSKRTLQVAPDDNVASPQGWHRTPMADDPMGMGPGGPHGLPWSPTTYSTPLPTSIYPSGIITEYPRPSPTLVINYTNTSGNNVIAQANWLDERNQYRTTRPSGGPHLVFDFPYSKGESRNFTSQQSRQCMSATVTQYFYLANIFHDIMFWYGFDEESGNFQQYNFGRSEGEQDAVIISVRDGHSAEVARFTTPPDGKSGRCQVDIRDFYDPFGSAEAETRALFYALSYGLVARLTGGPRDSSCLAYGEAAGLGMGWVQFLARMIRSSGIPSDNQINSLAGGFGKATPLMYNQLRQSGSREITAVGEVWADILEEVLRRLVVRHGYHDSLYPAQVSRRGNTLILQLLINGMKLQPCRPTFLQARDAILAADRDLTGGANTCLLWGAFASRGLGNDAKSLGHDSMSGINGFRVPVECREKPAVSSNMLIWPVFCLIGVISYGLLVAVKMRIA